MKSKDIFNYRFDLEQEILRVWGLKEDLELFHEKYLDGPTPMSEDEVSNTIAGLITMTDLRCEKAFGTFEKWCSADYERQQEYDNALETAARIAESEGLEQAMTVPHEDFRTRIARKIRSLKVRKISEEDYYNDAF
jgi:hypothetical protein